MVKIRARGSAQISAQAFAEGLCSGLGPAIDARARSPRWRAQVSSDGAARHDGHDLEQARGRVGLKQCARPMPAVTAMPKIIISQVIVAAAARRRGAVAVARSARSEVPEAPTPSPISA